MGIKDVMNQPRVRCLMVRWRRTGAVSLAGACLMIGCCASKLVGTLMIPWLRYFDLGYYPAVCAGMLVLLVTLFVFGRLMRSEVRLGEHLPQPADAYVAYHVMALWEAIKFLIVFLPSALIGGFAFFALADIWPLGTALLVVMCLILAVALQILRLGVRRPLTPQDVQQPTQDQLDKEDGTAGPDRRPLDGSSRRRLSAIRLEGRAMASEWFFQAGGATRGPVSGKELRSLAQRGVVTADTRVRRGSQGKWVSARRVKGLFEPSGDKSADPPPTPASGQPTPPPIAASKIPGNAPPTGVSQAFDPSDKAIGVHQRDKPLDHTKRQPWKEPVGVALLILGSFTSFVFYSVWVSDSVRLAEPGPLLSVGLIAVVAAYVALGCFVYRMARHLPSWARILCSWGFIVSGGVIPGYFIYAGWEALHEGLGRGKVGSPEPPPAPPKGPPPVPPPVGVGAEPVPDAVADGSQADRLRAMRPIHWMLVTGGAVVALVVLVGSLSFFGGDSGDPRSERPLAEKGAGAEDLSEPLEKPRALSPADVYAKAAPAVVIIRSWGPTPPDLFFFVAEELGVGSGFVVEPGDFIVTNEHVIHGASELEIKTHGGKTAWVTGVLAVDEKSDVAVLPVPDSLKGTPSLKLATSVPRVGDPVYAIGAPKGLEFTFTEGVVSQIRELFLEYGSVIQHDVSVSPGSSGGPLVNATGEVVGVNKLVSVAKAKAHNLNFAVASSSVDSALQSTRYQKLTDLDGYKARVRLQKSLAEASKQRATRDAARKRQLDLRSRWRKLRHGMSTAEVEKLLGSPDHVSTYPGERTWTYGSYPSSGKVYFSTRTEGGRVSRWSEPLRW